MRIFRRHRGLNLALQGGGAHGAFTWGVLDRLLEEDRFDPRWISATSAGAINAVALASGLAQDGPEGARKKLRDVWEDVHKAGVPDFVRMNPFLYGLSQSPTMAQVASMWSPYDFNPLGFDPLRRLLEEHIDFEALRETDCVHLLIAATDVADGSARLFRNDELTVEAILASACLPTLHHAVQIDGRAYWDGGYSANPDLVTLAKESPVRDTLIVQISPLVQNSLPTGVREITARANRLTFNAPLLRDVSIIETVRETTKWGWVSRRSPLWSLAAHRFHLIEATRYTSSLSVMSSVKPDWDLFTYLHGAGRTEASKWIDRHGRKVGRKSSVNLKERYLSRRSSDGEAANMALTDDETDNHAPVSRRSASA